MEKEPKFEQSVTRGECGVPLDRAICVMRLTNLTELSSSTLRESPAEPMENPEEIQNDSRLVKELRQVVEKRIRQNIRNMN